MKIVSLNTWGGLLHKPLLDFFENNKEIDIFCLQEIYHEAEGKENRSRFRNDALTLFTDIQAVLDTHVGYFRPSVADYYGLAIFVRKEISLDEEGDLLIFENEFPEERGKHSRNLQYIRFSINGKPTLLANVHGLWNGMGKTDTPDRLEQSKRIQNFVHGKNEQKIVVGDFNLNPDTESLAIAEEGMRNLVKEYGITSTRTSFYEKEGKFADYALVSPEVTVIDFKVLPEEVSDHAPLHIEID
ncbi:MAG: endonuclease/exonuclease/phosphatase family protein [Minisyncoccia bacterium]